MLTTALYERFASRDLDDDFADKVLSAMRKAVRRPRREEVIHELEVLPDADAVAARGAELIAEAGARSPRRAARSDRGQRRAHALRCTVNSKTRVALADDRDLPDRRAGRAGGLPDRNLTHLIAALSIGAQGSLRPMPVNDDDLEAAAAVRRRSCRAAST